MYTFAEKLIYDASTNTITGVQCMLRNGRRLTVRAAKEVIVSAGAINTPQLLMLSGIGPKAHLDQLSIKSISNLEGSGNNLQDHVTNIIWFEYDFLAVNPVDISQGLLNYLLTGSGPLSGLQATDILMRCKTDGTQLPYPDLEMHNFVFGIADPLIYIFLQRNGYGPEYLAKFQAANQVRGVIGLWALILYPKSSGRIMLRSTNPLDPPFIYADYYTDEEDVNQQLKSIRFIEQLESTPTLRRINAKLLDLKLSCCSSYEFRTDDYWKCFMKCTSATIYHPSSTARMGRVDDPATVVDPELKVKNLKGLRVVDASIMPKIVGGNLNGPTIMIAEKPSDIIKNAWQ